MGKKILKWSGIALGAIVGLLVVVVGSLNAISCSRQGAHYDVTPQAVAAATDPQAIAEGERLYVARGCGECHAENGAGRVLIDDPALGRIVPVNVPAVVARYSDLDLVRAIRHGVASDGRPLIFMPAHEFYGMSDRDLGCILGYLRTMPQVESDLPPTQVGVLGRVLHVVGALPMVPAELIDHDAVRPASPEPGVTVAYGAYIAIGCIGCHGASYSGGPIPGAPVEVVGIPRNLTPHASGLAAWNEEDFARLLRTGIRHDGTAVNPDQMPWRVFQRMTDTEISAVWMFLQSLPPREFGGR